MSSFYCPNCGLKLAVNYGSEVKCSRDHRWLLAINGGTLLCELKNGEDYGLIERIKHKVLQALQDVADYRQGKE